MAGIAGGKVGTYVAADGEALTNARTRNDAEHACEPACTGKSSEVKARTTQVDTVVMQLTLD